jgi:hypothetical protein
MTFRWAYCVSLALIAPLVVGASERTLSAWGKVVDAAGRPVAGAAVYVREWSFARRSATPDGPVMEDVMASTSTAADGTFAFRDIRLPKPYLEEVSPGTPSPWDVVATAPGHGIGWTRLPGSNPRKPIIVALATEGVLRGRVTNGKGDPIPGARIQAVRFQGLDQESQSPATSADNLRLEGSRIRCG